jgi:hypothetical protein
MAERRQWNEMQSPQWRYLLQEQNRSKHKKNKNRNNDELLKQQNSPLVTETKLINAEEELKSLISSRKKKLEKSDDSESTT